MMLKLNIFFEDEGLVTGQKKGGGGVVDFYRKSFKKV